MTSADDLLMLPWALLILWLLFKLDHTRIGRALALSVIVAACLLYAASFALGVWELVALALGA